MATDNSIYLEPLQVPEGTRTPGDIQALVDLVGQYLRVQGVENYSQILVGANPPPVDAEDAIWFETDGTGEPQSLKVWDGFTWRILEFRVPYGATGDRPPAPKDGEKFYDMDIRQELVYLSGAWRTSWGGPGQRIFVHAPSSQEAERMYPGWTVDEDAQGMFLRGAGEDLGSGSTGGSEDVNLTVENLPAHRHEGIELEVAAWGDSQDLGNFVGVKSPHIEHGVRTMPKSRTGSTGEGQPVKVTPPYYALWVLKRLEY